MTTASKARSKRSRTAVRVGEQRPRVANVPRYVSSAGQEAIELARASGLVLDPWQEFVLDESLGERRDGKWSAFEVAMFVPRQNGKGEILLVRELAGLYLFGEELLLHSAHEFKTAQEAFTRTLATVERVPELDAKVVRVRTSHGEEGIEIRMSRGEPVQRLRFVARSTHSGRGFTGDVVVLDEAYALTPAMIAALMPTLSARPNPQIWYASSQGDASAAVLNAVRRRGHAGSETLAYFEHSAPEDADLDDRRAWRKANPALGIRISEEYVEREREAMTDADFARERLGIPILGSRETAIPEASWDAVQDGDAAASAPMRFALDVLPDRSAASIVVAGANSVVELVEHRPGTAWVKTRAVRLARKWKSDFVIDGRGPASSIADEIEKRGVTVERMDSSEVADACAAFVDAVTARRPRVRVRPHELLNAAVAGAVKKPLGDRFVWSRTKSTTDVTPLMAACLATSEDETGEDFAFVV